MERLTPVDRLSRYIGEKISWLYLIAVIFSVYEVVRDSIFGAPTIWVHDLTIMLCAVCFLLGGAYAMQRREHIRITAVYEFLPRKIKRWLDIVSLVLALIYMAVLSYFTTAQAIESIALVERSGRAWDFPMPMIVRTAFSLACLLLTVQVASHLCARVRIRQVPGANYDQG